jgi:hypothetical protein
LKRGIVAGMTQRGDSTIKTDGAVGPGEGSWPVSGPAWQALAAHLGEDSRTLPVVVGTWPPYEHVNV